MKHSLLLFVIALCALQARSQSERKIRISGRVYDNERREFLSGASIACLYAGDSSRAAFTFTDKNGSFRLEGLSPAGYYLYVTYLGYQPVWKQVKMQDSIIDLGNIIMHRMGLTLDPVNIVEARPPVRMTKDTVSFNARSFKTRAHSLLEELFKKIPGVVVDGEGNISINGEPVKAILINGRPFFEGDPKLVVKNLQAYLVDKIQLIDRKVKERDPAVFNDGQTEKAINITIKEKWLELLTGQLMAGYGTDDRFAVKAGLHRFTSHQQLAFFANGDNVNGYQNGKTIGGGGILRAWNTNLSYSADLNEKININSSYRMEEGLKMDQRNSTRQFFVQDSGYYYNQQSGQQSHNLRHAVTTRLSYKIDSSSTLVAGSYLSFTSANDLVKNEHASYGNQSQLLDSGSMKNTNRNKGYGIGNSLTFTRKFGAGGRALNVLLDYSISNTSGEMYNLSDTRYVHDNGVEIPDTLNQHQELNSYNRQLQFMITYTGPVFKDHLLNISYGLTNFKSPSNKSAYDFNPTTNHYDQLNDSLSSHFESGRVNHLAILGLRTEKQKYDYSFSLLIMHTTLTTSDVQAKESTRLRNVAWMPGAYLGYAFTNNKRLRFSYNGSPELPAAEQLQPVPDNSNPLFIKKGNPGLKPGSYHQFNVYYNSFNPTSLRSFSLGINGGFAVNQVIDAISIDSLNRQISQPMNISGAYNLLAYASNSFPVKKTKTLIKTNTTIACYNNINEVNGVKGNSKNLSLTQSIGYSYSYKECFDFNTSANFSYNRAQYAVAATNYFNYSGSFDGNMNLPGGFIIGTTLNYMLATGRGAGYNTDCLMWNGFVSKTLFKKRQGLIKLQGFDLLNRNVSISRNTGRDYIEDVQTKVLQRFCLFSFTYFIIK